MALETRWNDEVAAALVEAVEDLPDTTVGKMFGHPALYARGKLFACAFGDGVGLKLPADVVIALAEDEDFEPFQPYGKARMREWVLLLATDREAVHTRSGLLEQSARFAAGKDDGTARAAADGHSSMAVRKARPSSASTPPVPVTPAR